MKKVIVITILVIIANVLTFGQDENPKIDEPLGHRIKRNGQDYFVYADNNLKPNFKDYRKINYKVYFRKIEIPKKEFNNKMYQLISIPGSSVKQEQNDKENLVESYPRAGETIDKEDYDKNFWIEVEVIEKYAETEHYKYANDFFSGFLTAPFKYRLKLNNAPESFMDGDFNVSPFLGWKWRISSTRSYYLAPFGFAGVTSLNYNSANNTKISEADRIENGTGITYGAGLSFRFNKISPGFIIGWDKGLGDLGTGFLYNEKPWISFSINFDFFKENKTSEGNQK